jgi:hypothetical protein
MKTPPLLLFAALVFWGWESGLLLAGIITGVMLEAALLFQRRWDLEDNDFNRIWGFCVLVIVAAAAYIFTTNDEGGGLAGMIHGASVHNVSAASTLTTTTVLRWLPLAFLPLMVAQTYNLRPSVPLTAVSLVMRWRQRRGHQDLVTRYLDVSYPYFMTCVFSAGVHPNQASQTYFWGGSLLILWALWVQRSRRFGVGTYAGVLTVVLALGFLGQFGINQAERLVQQFDAQWVAHLFHTRTDALQSATSIGQLGNLKLSPRIIIRLEPAKVGTAPLYLREASYRNYHPQNQTWYAGGSRKDFQEVYHDSLNETAWTLIPGKTNAFAANIACYLDGWSTELTAPEGLLPLPTGSWHLKNLPALTLKVNPAGAVLAAGPGLMIFDAYFGPGKTLDAPPDTSTNQFDLLVPTNEIPALEKVTAEMKVTGSTADPEKLQAVARFFFGKFSYTTWQGPDKLATNSSPLTRFLLNSRSGHCEYFATATVLLLRELKIPARYAVGYAVHEPSGSGYVVRERDAHAWCLWWNSQTKTWEDFDTTPASWIAIEGRHSAVTDWLSDAGSWVGFQIAKFRWRQTQLRQYILWMLIPVMVVLLYYIIFRRKAKARAAKIIIVTEPAVVWPGHDSAFYRLEKALAKYDLPRPDAESLSHWLERLLLEPALARLQSRLLELLQLHYRYRFDPRGLNDAEKLELEQKVASVLQALSAIPAEPRADRR